MHGTHRSIFVGGRPAKVDHEAIAEVLRHIAVPGLHRRHRRLLVGTHHGAVVFGIELLDSFVQSTRSQNSTVTWGGAGSGAWRIGSGMLVGASAGVAVGVAWGVNVWAGGGNVTAASMEVDWATAGVAGGHTSPVQTSTCPPSSMATRLATMSSCFNPSMNASSRPNSCLSAQ